MRRNSRPACWRESLLPTCRSIYFHLSAEHCLYEYGKGLKSPVFMGFLGLNGRGLCIKDGNLIDCGYDADNFFTQFIMSGLADQFGNGNPKYIAGLSCIELAREVVFQTSGIRPTKEATQDIDKDATYWAGWALAHYQWFSGLRFADLVRGGLTVSKVRSLYILHEADISKFIEVADSIIATTMNAQPTRLKTIRKARGFTQQELSEASGVKLRMIQLYEQRRNNINEASATSVINLANALGCQPIDLMEPVQ